MAKRKTIGQALREANLKEPVAKRIIDDRDFARLVVRNMSLLHESFPKLSIYHGKADLTRLPQVIETVRKRDGGVKDCAVAAELQITKSAFSKLLHKHPEIKVQYDKLRSINLDTNG